MGLDAAVGVSRVSTTAVFGAAAWIDYYFLVQPCSTCFSSNLAKLSKWPAGCPKLCVDVVRNDNLACVMDKSQFLLSLAISSLVSFVHFCIHHLS